MLATTSCASGQEVFSYLGTNRLTRSLTTERSPPMTRPPLSIAKMPFEKYGPTLPLVLAERTWPSRAVERRAPLVQRRPQRRQPGPDRPMGPERKLSLFETLLASGSRR